MKTKKVYKIVVQIQVKALRYLTHLYSLFVHFQLDGFNFVSKIYPVVAAFRSSIIENALKKYTTRVILLIGWNHSYKRLDWRSALVHK